MKKNVVEKYEIFLWKSSPTRHIKYKVINFASSNQSTMQISFLQPIWNDF